MSLTKQTRLEPVFFRHADTVYRICLSFMKNPSDAEDLSQETFLRLLRSGKEFASPEHEKAWLIVTASNLCKDQLRHWWRRRASLEESNLSYQVTADVSDVVLAIQSLPNGWKTVVYLYYYEGWSTGEISRYLKCPEGTVRSRLDRARKRLKDLLGGVQENE